MTHTATYSPEDNKLRIYPGCRLDADEFAKVKAKGFKWAPRQQIFVAPMWTPSRFDLCVELAGEVEDEGMTLAERQAERAARFEQYSENRRDDAERARQGVAAIADNIPLGQPILIGHHSEKHARRDAEKIESGMRKTVSLWETSKYWTERAAGALFHAKYKELPAVRARRIKTLEADQRKHFRAREAAEKALAAWTAPDLTHEKAVRLANGFYEANFHMPRKEGDRPDFQQTPDAYTCLTGSYPNLYAPRTFEEVKARAAIHYPPHIAKANRWIAHFDLRLAYERQMLGESGYVEPKKVKRTLLPICNYRAEGGISVLNEYRRGETNFLPQVEMTQAEYAAINKDYKGTSVAADKSHRVRVAIVKSARVTVFLKDSKTHEKPAAPAPAPEAPRELPPAPVPHRPTAPRPVDPMAADMDAMKQSLKAGVQVISAPQLFPTPPDLARRVIDAAEIQPGQKILEPSAGTGNLLAALSPEARLDATAIEISPALASNLRTSFPARVLTGDFLSYEPGATMSFPRIVMNPPFENGADIRHIQHARRFLTKGGRLVAICANGPRQRAALMDDAAEWHDLPAGSFASQGTGVNTALVIFTA